MDLLFTKTAEAILDRARHVARRIGAVRVSPDHVFLALLVHEEGLAADLQRCGVDVGKLRIHLEALVASEERDDMVVFPPLDGHTEDTLEQAAREAWGAGHNRIGVRDILLALIDRPWDRGAWILVQCDVDVGALRDRLRPPRRGRSESPPPEPSPAYGGLARGLEEDVHTRIRIASQEAAAQDYRRVQPQHLLMGLLAPEDGLAAQVCRAIELDPLDLRDEAARWIASDAEGQLIGGVRVSRSVVEILQSALEASVRRGAPLADCSDVLSAMLFAGDPFLPTILERFHIPAREFQHELLDLVGTDLDAVLKEAAEFSTEAGRQVTHDAELDRALARAREAAAQNCADHVGTEHHLLALVLDPRSAAARTLRACGIDLDRAREAIEPATWGRSAPQDDLPMTPRADRAMHVARLEARHLGHPRVGTGHLLLALYWQRKGTASRLLQDLGVVPSRLRKEVLAATAPEGDTERRVFPPLTTRARVVLRQASRLVTGPAWPAVNRGHLLQALLRQQGGTARGVLESLVIERESLVARAERWANEAEETARPRAFTDSVWGILGTAWAEAERQGLGHVGTGHLLYGLFAGATSRMVSILRADDPPPSHVRAVLDRILASH